MANQTRFDNFKACSGEKGILTLITQQRIIRRAYLNNRPIAAQIDTCSLVSVVESSNPKPNRILEVGKKIKMRPLHWEKEWWEESPENCLVSEPKMRFKPILWWTHPRKIKEKKLKIQKASIQALYAQVMIQGEEARQNTLTSK